MTKDEAIQVILFECQEMDGFLVKLRSRRDFDAEQFQNLVDAIQIYRDGIIGEDCMNRRVAGSLFYIATLLGDVTQHVEKYNLPDKETISRANAELWNLVESLYDI